MNGGYHKSSALDFRRLLLRKLCKAAGLFGAKSPEKKIAAGRLDEEHTQSRVKGFTMF